MYEIEIWIDDEKFYKNVLNQFSNVTNWMWMTLIQCNCFSPKSISIVWRDPE